MAAQDVLAQVSQSNVSPVPVCTTTTTNATPATIALIPVEPGGSILARVLVIARRSDTGATKAWDVTISIKRVGSANATAEANTGAASPLVSAGDTASMTNAAIALAVSGGSVGVQVTGIAAVTIQWAVQIQGLLLTQ